jgi:GTPase involved in cell partitioning and DNA repair
LPHNASGGASGGTGGSVLFAGQSNLDYACKVAYHKISALKGERTEMRNTTLMNGGLIGFGLGFIASSLALLHLVADYLPKSAEVWYLQGIGIIGGVGLVIGIGFEIYERTKEKRESAAAEE